MAFEIQTCMIWPPVKKQLQLKFLKPILAIDDVTVIEGLMFFLALFLVNVSMFCEVRVTKPAQAPKKQKNGSTVVARFFFVPVQVWCI